MLFSNHVSLHHFLLLHFYILSFFCSISCYYSKAFYTAWHFMVTSLFQMSNKFINFESWLNIYGLPLFWCSWQIVVMLLCFEAALFICSKNVWNFPRRISFVIDQIFCCIQLIHIQLPITCFDCTISCFPVHAWLLKQNQGMVISPFI